MLAAATMSFFSTLKAKIPGQAQDSAGEGQQSPLTKQMIASIRSHLTWYADTDLTAYTYDRKRTDYAAARADLTIYNENKLPVLHGREMNNGQISVWPY
jgi:hypothetical protein